MRAYVRNNRAAGISSDRLAADVRVSHVGGSRRVLCGDVAPIHKQACSTRQSSILVSILVKIYKQWRKLIKDAR